MKQRGGWHGARGFFLQDERAGVRTVRQDTLRDVLELVAEAMVQDDF